MTAVSRSSYSARRLLNVSREPFNAVPAGRRAGIRAESVAPENRSVGGSIPSMATTFLFALSAPRLH
jgi:hypothetical protein